MGEHEFLISEMAVSTKDQGRRTSRQFYESLNPMVNCGAGPMAHGWSHSPQVSTMHSVEGPEIGWEAVQASWEGIAAISSGGEVRLSDERVHTAGDLAYETGTEHVKATLDGEEIESEIRVTNIYRREKDTWKIIHPHTDPAMQEVVR